MIGSIFYILIYNASASVVLIRSHYVLFVNTSARAQHDLGYIVLIIFKAPLLELLLGEGVAYRLLLRLVSERCFNDGLELLGLY